jgi:hypothetical protein
MTRRSLALRAVVLLILVAGVGVLYAVRSQESGTRVYVPSSAIPSIAATPAPSASRTPSAGVRATAVAAIPKDFAYIESGPAREVTLWLVDLSGAAAPAAVARWAGGTGSFGASRDGKTVIVVAPGNRSILGLHLVRPLTGEATVLFEGQADGRVFFPRLSPDGSTFAIDLLNAGSGEGILIGDVATGATRALAGTSGRGSSVVPFDWSDDGQWLAYFHEEIAPEGSGCCTYLENVRDGRRVRLGLATMVSWRATEPRLVVAKQDRTGNQGAFGATVSTFDLTLQRRTNLLSIDPRITTLKWSPTKDELLYVQETLGCSYHGTLWTTAVGGAAKRIGSADTVQDAWWAADGLTIYALVRGDGADSPIIEAASGRWIAVIPNDAPRACP